MHIGYLLDDVKRRNEPFTLLYDPETQSWRASFSTTDETAYHSDIEMAIEQALQVAVRRDPQKRIIITIPDDAAPFHFGSELIEPGQSRTFARVVGDDWKPV